MATQYLILIAAVYGACVHLNYIWFNGVMAECEDHVFAKRFWFYIASGPLLAGYVIYKKIKRFRRKMVIKKTIKKAIEDQLPALLEEYNITVEGDSK